MPGRVEIRKNTSPTLPVQSGDGLERVAQRAYEDLRAQLTQALAQEGLSESRRQQLAYLEQHLTTSTVLEAIELLNPELTQGMLYAGTDVELPTLDALLALAPQGEDAEGFARFAFNGSFDTYQDGADHAGWEAYRADPSNQALLDEVNGYLSTFEAVEAELAASPQGLRVEGSTPDTYVLDARASEAGLLEVELWDGQASTWVGMAELDRRFGGLSLVAGGPLPSTEPLRMEQSYLVQPGDTPESVAQRLLASMVGDPQTALGGHPELLEAGSPAVAQVASLLSAQGFARGSTLELPSQVDIERAVLPSLEASGTFAYAQGEVDAQNEPGLYYPANNLAALAQGFPELSGRQPSALYAQALMGASHWPEALDGEATLERMLNEVGVGAGQTNGVAETVAYQLDHGRGEIALWGSNAALGRAPDGWVELTVTRHQSGAFFAVDGSGNPVELDLAELNAFVRGPAPAAAPEEPVQTSPSPSGTAVAIETMSYLDVRPGGEVVPIEASSVPTGLSFQGTWASANELGDGWMAQVAAGQRLIVCDPGTNQVLQMVDEGGAVTLHLIDRDGEHTLTRGLSYDEIPIYLNNLTWVSDEGQVFLAGPGVFPGQEPNVSAVTASDTYSLAQNQAGWVMDNIRRGGPLYGLSPEGPVVYFPRLDEAGQVHIYRDVLTDERGPEAVSDDALWAELCAWYEGAADGRLPLFQNFVNRPDNR